MRRWLGALALAAACGHAAPATSSAPPGEGHATPATCEAIVAHLADVFGQKDLAPADRADLIASCEKDKPPPTERACVMAARTPADVDACGRAGARPAPGAAPAAAPDDPRADLLELGQRVARYHAELGEWPPAAPATPPEGACCAAACAADASQWSGPWQLVRFGLAHATRWSFAIERRDDGGVVVRAIGCPGATSYQLAVPAGAAPAMTDVTEAP